MRDAPLVVTPQERLAHTVEDLRGVTGLRVFPKQDGESVVGGIGPDLHRTARADIGDLMDHGRLVGVCPVERAPQQRIGQSRTIPDDGAQKIAGRGSGEAGEHPLGLPVQVCEAPVRIEGENPLADALEQIQRLRGLEQPIEPCMLGGASK
jgi:hypothetical protein